MNNWEAPQERSRMICQDNDLCSHHCHLTATSIELMRLISFYLLTRTTNSEKKSSYPVFGRVWRKIWLHSFLPRSSSFTIFFLSVLPRSPTIWFGLRRCVQNLDEEVAPDLEVVISSVEFHDVIFKTEELASTSPVGVRYSTTNYLFSKAR